ncbi:hypothetical protein MMAS_17870 [Mycobacteroides abscessus subsp. massiliense CCUG 48898 = JCM 15300]|nr:hypothetical protein MMAS_17870 [Mycobacteroides abscessus subsp. massiliense CCUG 48898 = JCM 15300]
MVRGSDENAVDPGRRCDVKCAGLSIGFWLSVAEKGLAATDF